MAPDGVLPVVGRLVLFKDKLLVHLHAQTGQTRQVHMAVRDGASGGCTFGDPTLARKIK